MGIYLDHPLDKFERLQIPYPFYCIEPMISNTEIDMGKYSGRFAFNLMGKYTWRDDTTDSDQREFLLKHAIERIDYYFANIIDDISREDNEENVLRDAGKLFTGGVRI